MQRDIKMSSLQLKKNNKILSAVRQACKSGNPQPVVDYINANDVDGEGIKAVLKAFHIILRRKEFRISIVVAMQSSVFAELRVNQKEDPILIED